MAPLEGDDAVLSNLENATEVFIPAVALGELFFGAAKSGRPSENTARVERFASGRSIISADLDIAREFMPLTKSRSVPCRRRHGGRKTALASPTRAGRPDSASGRDRHFA
jgi:hypothetical protein